MSKQKRKNTVLVVDDNRVSLTHLIQILEDEYMLHVASSGVEAIQVAKAVLPDIILMDIVMPNKDGYEALAELREIHETKEIPVIFITSLDQDSSEEKGLRLGAMDYIAKPFNPMIVKLRVATHLKLVNQMRTIARLSMVDEVTELPNRNYFDKRLGEEWQRAKDSGSTSMPLGILLIDVDKLRSYNNIYGYRQGDSVLRAVAEIMATVPARPGDIAARWADDGFAILLQNSDGGECNAVGEKLRKYAEEKLIPTNAGEGTRFTLSIGANSVVPATCPGGLEQFVSNADSALYLAKELGRNQVVVYS